MKNGQSGLNDKAFKKSLGENRKLKSGRGSLLEMCCEIVKIEFKKLPEGRFSIPSGVVEDTEI